MDLLDPKEVLRNLNEMGFQNISASQLKEFIYDLKKLIKYDSQKHQRELLNEELEREKLFDYLYKASTTSFSAKCSKKKQNYIPVPFEKKKPSSFQPNCQSYVQNKKIKHDCKNRLSSNKCYRNDHSLNASDAMFISHDDIDGSRLSIQTDSINPELINPKSSSTLINKSSKSKAFIRPRIPSKKPVNKSDPVALYYAYQSDWQKFKHQMPGQTNRNALRWNIREKMNREC